MTAQESLEAFLQTEYFEPTGMPAPAADEPLLSSAGGAIDSLGLQQLIVFLEEELGVEVLDDDIQPETFETLTALRSYVASRIDSRGTEAASPTEAGG